MKNNRLFRQTATMLLALAMVFTMMPLLGAQDAYAETAEANGGTVASNSKNNAEAAFGAGNVTAEYSSASGTLTITLNTDIGLKAPVVIKKGSSGKKVVIDLNGHTITAAEGISGDSAEAAKGKDAIRIIPADYDVEIKGGGTVTGGKGAVIETEDHFRYGARGGDAVSFIADGDSYWNPQNNDAELSNGLTVTGGAVLTGGAGGDISGDDWRYSIDNFSGEHEHTLGDNGQFQLKAGAGGSGIGQPGTGIAYAQVLLAYARIIIENGTVNGGPGGAVDMTTAHTPVLTYYGLMNAPAIDRYMQELSNRDKAFDNYVDSAIKLRPGRGGDAILIGAGRKYLRVDQGSTVKGGRCGTMDYGRSKYVSCLSNEAADCGDGIGVYGDIGLKNVEPSLTESNMSSKNANSGDTGIYISGTVMGGSPAAAEAKHENCGNGGNGIYVQGEDEYFETDMRFPQGEDPVKWGIVAVDAAGKVCGGDASTAVYGNGGAGGHGICEGYTKGDDQSDDSRIGTDYYLIKGEAKGGKGGNSLTYAGSGGGDGLSFANWRKNTVVIGGGRATGGDSGKGTETLGTGNPIPGGQGVRYYPDNREDLNNTVSLTETEGRQSSKKTVSNTGLSVTAAMSSFSRYPSTSTKLSCSITKPSGYSGGVYVTWHARTQLQSNTPESCIIEPPGTSSTSFNLLSNAQYKYLAYETHSIPAHDYNLEVATVERIKEILEIQNCTAKIWCVVVLEDGRWAKSNVMTVKSGSGWNGPAPSGDDPAGDDADVSAATAVVNMIEKLPATITLDDRDAVYAAWNAYEGLSDGAKEKIWPQQLEKLEAARARIDELQYESDKEAADEVAGQISALGDSVTLDDEEAVEAAREAYEALTEDQKALVDEDVLEILEQAETVIEGLNQDAADAVEALINAVPDLTILSSEDPEDEEAKAEARTAVEEAAEAYAGLSVTQKALIDPDLRELLRVCIEEYNEALPEGGEALEDPTKGIELTADMVTVEDAVYNGKELTPAVTVKYEGRKLKEDTDYSLTYSDNIKAGKGKVTVEGSGVFGGAVSAEFNIARKKITPAVKLSKASFTWNGKAQTPGVTVKDGGVVLKKNSDYTVTYAKGRKNTGTYAVTVSLKGNYTGSKKVTFTIVPKGTGFTRAAGSKKAVTLTWARQKTKMPKVITGYQIQYSLRKDFKSGNKAVNVGGYTKTARKISGLAAKRTYYFRVRTYTKTGGKTYYSSWSKVKAARTK